MFSRLRLRESFRFVCTDSDWACFNEGGEITDIDVWIASFGGDDPKNKSVRRRDQLARLFTEQVHAKLTAGLWSAEGFKPDLPEPVSINRHLWPFLQIDPHEGSAEGSDLRVVNLLISAQQPAGSTGGHRESSQLRSQLIKWLEGFARSSPTSVTRAAAHAAAREAFPHASITANLFGEVWRASDLPPSFLHKGRPSIR